MRIQSIQNFIDFIRRKKSRKLKDILKLQKRYRRKIQSLKVKIRNGQKIKVAFLAMYATSNQNLSIFNKMLDDSGIFDPIFIVNPDVSRSSENFQYNYTRTKNELIEKYGNSRVLDGYDQKTSEYRDFTDEFDIVFTNNPYDLMAHRYFKISYWAEKTIPIFYISYFYMGRCHVTISNLQKNQFNCLHTYFAENHFVKKLAKKYSLLRGKNVTVTGYPKLDEFATVISEPHERKRIIVSPHHTIDEAKTSVGGFLEYSDILLKLPGKYPQIDFIFRPHPMLFERIKSSEIWTAEEIDSYLERLLSHENVIYSTEGEYFDKFVNSDGLIHDCGSFSAEYLCTGHPAAYYIRSSLDFDATLTDLGKECIRNHYPLRVEEDFYRFIDEVILNGKDTLKSSREKFAKSKLMINYPNATHAIYEYMQNLFN